MHTTSRNNLGILAKNIQSRKGFPQSVFLNNKKCDPVDLSRQLKDVSDMEYNEIMENLNISAKKFNKDEQLRITSMSDALGMLSQDVESFTQKNHDFNVGVYNQYTHVIDTHCANGTIS